MRDAILEEKRRRDRDSFLCSIDTKEICRVASSYHGGDACEIFHSAQGSFNACFFLQFEQPADKWVFRIPFPGLPTSWIDEKVEREVATMKSVGPINALRGTCF